MIAVRRAGPADIPALVELMHAFYAEASFPLDRAWATRAFDGLMTDASRGAAWLIERAGAPVGHVVLSIRYAMEFGGLIGYIDDLFVIQAHRRVGAARAGIDALVAECRQRRCVSLHVEVAPDNVAATSLYRSYGLVPGEDDRQYLKGPLPPAG